MVACHGLGEGTSTNISALAIEGRPNEDRFANVFATSLDLVASQKIHVAALISAVFPLADMKKAMDLAVKKHEVVKIQVEP